jgi:hypothetical protein
VAARGRRAPVRVRVNDTLTYCGLVDDFAARHGQVAIASPKQLNRHLLFSVLFGDPVLINDGHVIANAALRDAVANPGGSPFRALVESGHVQILTRNHGRLGELADHMAENQRITSAQRLLSLPEFTKSFQPALADWAQRLGSKTFRNTFVRWPDIPTDAVFGAVTEPILERLSSTRAVGKKGLAEFRERLAASAGRRTEWEDIATGLTDRHRLSAAAHRRLMKSANEAYQYAWGCILCDADALVRVEIGLPAYVGSLDQSLGPAATAARRPILVRVPDMDFAERSVGKRWKQLAQATDPKEELSVTKYEFLGALARYHTSDEVADAEIEQLAQRYSTQLSKHFGRDGRVATGIDVTFLVVATAASFAVTGTPGAVLGFAFGSGQMALDKLRVSRLLWRLGAPDPERWMQPRGSVSSRAASSFLIEPLQAAVYRANAGTFSGRP